LGLVLAGIFYSTAWAQTSTISAAQRLDDPITSENSVPVKFADGVVLRVPKVLMKNRPKHASPNEIIEVEKLAFPIWYPDMTLASCFGTQCGPQLPTDPNDSNYESDKRFKIMLFPLEYSSDDRKHRDSRPLEILENRTNGGEGPSAVASGFKNLNRLSFLEANRKAHPEWKSIKALTRAEGGGELYANASEKEGEILMDCNAHTCNADTYDKSHHFQMHLFLLRTTPGVVAQTDDFVHALNQMIYHWRAQ
jgi:hypothetical protein